MMAMIPLIISAVQQMQQQQGSQGSQGAQGGAQQGGAGGMLGSLGGMMGSQGGGGGSSMMQPGLLGGQFGFSKIGQGILGGLGSLYLGNKIAGGYGDYTGQMQQSLGDLQKAQGQGLGYMKPFQEAGTAAIPQYQKDLSLLQDPEAARKFLLKGFADSPEAKMQLEAGTRASQAAASSSGMLGSGAQRAALEQFGQQVHSADVDKYLGQQQGMFGAGMQGLQGQEQLGLSAGQSMASFLSQMQQMEAQARAAIGQGQLGQAQAKAGGKAGFISDIGSLL